MINFFRKMRKQLADDNKPLKYMRYAVGEISLVVIGILIALSVNNWNEREKLLKQEKEILLLLEEELHDNLGVFDRANTGNRKILANGKDYLNYPSAYSHRDSIQNLMLLFNYHTAEIHYPILDKILDSSDDIIITRKDLLKKLRRLKRGYTSTNKALFYLDEFWNTNTASLLISSNLGNNMDNQQEKWKIEYYPDERFKTILIMQRAFILSYVKHIDGNITRSEEVSKQIQNSSLTD